MPTGLQIPTGPGTFASGKTQNFKGCRASSVSEHPVMGGNGPRPGALADFGAWGLFMV